MIIGQLTDQHQPLCLPCAAIPDLAAFRVGKPVEVIEHPAPKGVYLPEAINGRFYDEPCAVCGWAIRKEQA